MGGEDRCVWGWGGGGGAGWLQMSEEDCVPPCLPTAGVRGLGLAGARKSEPAECWHMFHEQAALPACCLAHTQRHVSTPYIHACPPPFTTFPLLPTWFSTRMTVGVGTG